MANFTDNPNSYYDYKTLESCIDQFVFGQPDLPDLIYHYRMLKWSIHGIACFNYLGCEQSVQASLAFAWEDAEIAFTGREIVPLSSIIEKMWQCVPADKHDHMWIMIALGREMARRNSDEHGRRYEAKYRDAELSTPESIGFKLKMVKPKRGPLIDGSGGFDTGQDVSSWAKKASKSVY